jgi:acetyl-CoA carboxylase biotin carboxyl carrier protein
MRFQNVASAARCWRSGPPETHVDEDGFAVADFSFEEVGEILRALERLDCTSVSLEYGDLKLEMRRDATVEPDRTDRPVPTPASAAVRQPDEVAVPHAPAPGPTPPANGDLPGHWVPVTTPMVGTFYRAPGPGEAPFVAVGDAVSPGQTVGVLEVMKLFTELTAEVEGKVARIDAEDAALVESGQALVWIEPS